jgi:hypothetical protein
MLAGPSVMADGRAVVVWLERTEAAAEIRARTVARDGRLGEPAVVAETSESRGSGFPRMALVGEKPLIAWSLMGESGGVRVAALSFGEVEVGR